MSRKKKRIVDYEESGIFVTMPEKQHFRFENSINYKKLSGNSLKEMDFCWLESVSTKSGFNEEKVLFLMEIWNKSPDEKTLETFTGKIIDSLMMLASLWLPNGYLCQDVPRDFHNPPNSIKIFIVMRRAITSYSDAHHLNGLKDELNGSLRARLRLFNIKEVIVLDEHDRKTIKNLGLEPYLPEQKK